MNKTVITTILIPVALGLAKSKLGSRSLEDVLFLAESRGSRYYVKIFRTINPDESERFRRNEALHQVVQGELASYGQSREMSDKEHYRDMFGKDWDSYGSSWQLKTDNKGYGGRTFEEMKYLAQKHIFDDSIWNGITYYVSFKPDDMFDPIEEDGFNLLNRDAVMNIQDMYSQRDFLVKKYGNRSRFKQDVAMRNLENMGFNTLADVTKGAEDHEVSRSDFVRIKDYFEKSRMNVDDDTVRIVSFIEKLFRQAWTVEARKYARSLAKKLK
jgi:hypothetical protein